MIRNTILTAPDSRAGPIVSAAFDAMRQGWDDVRSSLQAVSKRMRTRMILRSLNDHHLRDIGLTRIELEDNSWSRSKPVEKWVLLRR